VLPLFGSTLCTRSNHASPPACLLSHHRTGQILQASAQHWIQLLTGTLLIGLGMAPLLHSTWVECAEIAPPQWRAGFLACYAVGRSFGLWASLACMSAVDSSHLAHGWRVVVALGGCAWGNCYSWLDSGAGLSCVAAAGHVASLVETAALGSEQVWLACLPYAAVSWHMGGE
jgi:hypothetical protein